MPDYDPYLVVNPAAGNVYFDTSNTAISRGAQPNVNTGRGLGLGANQTLLNNLALGSTQTDIYGSQITTALDGVSATLPITGGAFATMTAGRYIMRRGGANTLFIANLANNTLRSGASDYGIRRSIHFRTVVRGPLTATAIREHRWMQFSGIWQQDYPTASTDGLGDVSGNVTGGSDDAATPTAATPGELVYIAGNSSTILIPVQDEYKARTTW